MKYRVALGIDPAIWGTMTVHRFKNAVLTEDEAKSLNYVNGTLILYTQDPDRVFGDLIRDGYTLTDFRWINISKEG